MKMRELADLDPSMSMSRTVEVLRKALDTIPFSEGQQLSLSGEQSRMLDLIDSKIDEAEGYFDRPVDEPEIYVRLVDIGKAAGRDDLVTKFGRRTAQIESSDLEFRARLQAFFGATSRAVELFQRSVDLTPDFQEAVDGLGRAERRVAKSERNLDKLAGKASASRGSAKAWMDLGQAERRVAKSERNIDKLSGKAQASRGSAKAWMDLGQAQADLDDLDGALESFSRSVELAPTDIAALCKKGGVLAALGRTGEAKECYEAALAIDGKSLNGKRGLNYTTWLLERE
jgi:tetratricopeptide (TPR) repeat protein